MRPRWTPGGLLTLLEKIVLGYIMDNTFVLMLITMTSVVQSTTYHWGPFASALNASRSCMSITLAQKASFVVWCNPPVNLVLLGMFSAYLILSFASTVLMLVSRDLTSYHYANQYLDSMDKHVNIIFNSINISSV